MDLLSTITLFSRFFKSVETWNESFPGPAALSFGGFFFLHIKATVGPDTKCFVLYISFKHSVYPHINSTISVVQSEQLL